jgi:putative endonuclease
MNCTPAWNPQSAVKKHLNFWKRIAKLRIIEQMNPDWLDLYREIAGLDSGLRQNDGH